MSTRTIPGRRQGGIILGLVILITGCLPRPLLEEVVFSADGLSPNGDGVGDEVTIGYRLSPRAYLSIFFQDSAGRRYDFRQAEPRSPGSYTARFHGTYEPKERPGERRVLPDGTYRWVVRAEAEGRVEEKAGSLTVVDADTQAPQVRDLVALPDRISPNGDAQNDELVLSYALSKMATVEIFATDGTGQKYLLEAPAEKRAALYSHRWNGTSGGRLLPDGTYLIHVVATDRAGNLTQAVQPVVIAGGGRPKLEISGVKFTPTALPVGGELQVEIRVRNAGDTVLYTLGPAPGTPYTTQISFNDFKDSGDPSARPLYFERPGVWRVGVDWGLSGRLYPVRWGLTPDLRPLLPGQEAVIRGSITVLIQQTREVFFWASAVQEGVGFPGGQVGQTKVIVSY